MFEKSLKMSQMGQIVPEIPMLVFGAKIQIFFSEIAMLIFGAKIQIYLYKMPKIHFFPEVLLLIFARKFKIDSLRSQFY